MFDFHFNVTLKQWNSSSRAVDPYYYQMEIEEIGAHDEVVARWTEVTKKTAVGVYLRILRDVKLRNTQNQLQAVDMQDDFWRFFITSREVWFLEACLLSNERKEKLMQL